MNECIFCKIIEDEAESEEIYETEKTLAFLDKRPRAPGHTLVIPKKHIKTMKELEDDLISEVFSTVKEVEKLLDKSLNPDAFTIGINDGGEAGQEIPHLHVNVIPRFKEDRCRPIQSLVNNNPEDSIKSIAMNIRESKQ